ncbi:MAG TPA: VOC family protein, partial [Phenylobacterium sp.]
MLRLDHVVFPVQDAGRSLDFYRDVLGLTLAEAHEGDDWNSYPWLMMVFALPDGRELVLVELKGAPAPSYQGLPRDARHYALAVEDGAELDGWRGRLRAAGLRFWEEDHGVQQSLYLEDPDGVVIEITAPPSRADPHSAQSAAL